ncbi:hypothetical protein FKO01_58005 [Mesorhizobium sp. B2-3-3]|nr:hypothetical protein FKO01_58005 [Mesorhizobium sp. B2-3-3]
MQASSQGTAVVALLAAAPVAPTETARRMAWALPARRADESGQALRCRSPHRRTAEAVCPDRSPAAA